MASSQDCKNFLANFFKKNPQILKEGFGNDPTVQKLAENPKNWKRRYKCKPGKDYYDSLYQDKLDGNENYLIFIDGYPGNKWMDGHKRMFPHNFIAERGFYCDPLEEQLSFIVLEDKEGKLYLGNYIGD